MQPLLITALLVGVCSLFATAPAAEAQTAATLRVTRATIVLDAPRGDSVRVGSVQPGDLLPVVGRQGNWFLVTAQPGAKGSWERGWVHAGSVELASGTLAGPRQAPPGRLRIRAFGQTGGVLHDARDSFDALVGSSFGGVYGAGAQVVFPNGAFVQGGVDRFRKTGSRVLASGTQIFTLDVPARITVVPVLATVGYRVQTTPLVAPYLGAGVGWHVLTEDAPEGAAAERIREGKIGYHVVGGAEITLGRFLAVGGEAQYATVPKALGETGVSAFFGEDNLGGATFRFKVIVGY